MALSEEAEAARTAGRGLSFIKSSNTSPFLILRGLSAIVVVAARGSLALKILSSLLRAGSFDPTDPGVFQRASSP
jgi:hypothetical protein